MPASGCISPSTPARVSPAAAGATAAAARAATVTLKAGGQTLATAKTASDGSYSLPCSWDKTSYTLLVQADGFADKEDLLYTQVATHDVTLTPSARGALKITVKSADGENLGL